MRSSSTALSNSGLCPLTYTARPAIYILSLHDALPISALAHTWHRRCVTGLVTRPGRLARGPSAGQDRKSTRLNSSHMSISYAVFRLKKKINREDYETARQLYAESLGMARRDGD